MSSFLHHRSVPEQVHLRYTSDVRPMYVQCNSTYRERRKSEVEAMEQWQRSGGTATARRQ
ncbi:MAG: hypothetical protein K2I27_05265 [Bacteroides sp.]|nr:hypothetical protein [Bacteroides sp.]